MKSKFQSIMELQSEIEQRTKRKIRQVVVFSIGMGFMFALLVMGLLSK